MFGMGKSNALVGLDIGSSSVKAIELRRKGSKYEVLHLAIEDFSPGAIVDGVITDGLSVAMAIGKVFAENNMKTTDVAMAVSGHSVIVKRIVAAGESPEQLSDAVAKAAEQAIQLDLNEVEWDYQVLGAAPGRNAHEVMLVAVKREKVLSYTDVVRQAGKNSVVVDIDAFALENAFEMSYHPPPDQVVALLNIGANMTIISVVRNGAPLFTRDVSAGAQQLTESLEKELDLSARDVEKLKRGEELPNVAQEVRAAHLRAALEPLIQEIRKTFDFFRETTSAGGVERLYLAGGSANVPGLTDILQEEFKTPVEVMNPFLQASFKGPKMSPEQIREIAPRMGVAMGLALRSFD